MGFSDEELDRACASVGAIEVPKTVCHGELGEVLWLMFNGRSLAEVLGEVRREYLAVAVEKKGSKREARRTLKIGNTTLYRIEQGRNKY